MIIFCLYTLHLERGLPAEQISENFSGGRAFSEGLMCLRIEWKLLYTSRISNREQLGKIHQL